MRCHHARELLNLTTPQTRSRLRSLRLSRHLQRCSACAAYAAWMSRLEGAVGTWRADAPPAGFAGRVDAAVENVTAPIPPVIPAGRRRLTLALATLCVVALTMVALLHTSPADAMQRMVDAVAHVRNAHVVTWSLPDSASGQPAGGMQQVEEMWYQDGRWRKEGKWGSRLIVAGPAGAAGKGVMGTYYRYDSRMHRVIGMQETGAQWSTFTIESLTGMSTHPGAYRLRMESQTHDGGRTLQVILVEPLGAAQTHRYRCMVDPATGLPAEIDSQNTSAGAWQTTIRYVFDFNENLPESLFDPQDLHHDHWSAGGR